MTELYKKYRPKTLERVVGNEGTVQALRNMLERKTLPHTILFHGPSGCGKTTLARILKDGLECSEMDFRELNCSDFRGIDTVREIARTMTLAPTGGPCRIWLLDEVHQMSKDGQNAALKILEDTPNHVYFFLCTTDPQKILPTIRTRCCEMPVKLLTEKEMGGLLERICKRESITLGEGTRDKIFDAAGGSARQALVILDKIASLPEEMREGAILALDAGKEAIDLCRALLKKESWGKVGKILQALQADPEQVRWAVMGYARSVLLKTSDHQAYHVICCFENHFFDSKEAGLARACFEAING